MHRLRIPLVVAAVAIAAALLIILPRADAGLLTKGPYIQNPGPTAMTVQYETAAPLDGFVRYGPGAALDQKVPAQLHEKVEYPENPKDKKSPTRAAYLYRARLTGLQPGTDYRYQVVPSAADETTAAPVKTFRTFPEKADRVTFIAYGDTRTNPSAHRNVAANFRKHDPAYILHTGDLIASGSTYALWNREFFDPLAEVIDHVPMMIAIGNHEKGQANVLRLFDMPGGRMWYSFDYGPVHVVVLDYLKNGPDVLAWLDQDLAAAQAPWKFAVLHYPLFNFGGHKTDANRLTFLPLFEKHGVDVVVAGHSHLYERFKPLARMGFDSGPAAAGAGAAGGSRQPITFITTGGGGATLTGSPPHDLLARNAKTYHYCVFAVDAETLRFQAFTSRGEELDALTLTKKSGRYDAAYLAQVRPMEEAILAQGVIPLTAPVVEVFPAGREPATVSIAVRFPGLGRPVTFQVRLAEESAKTYAMESVTVEFQPNAEKPLTFSLRSLANVVSGRDEKRQVLSPGPKFVLTAKSPPHEAVCRTESVTYRWALIEKAKALAAEEAAP